MSEQNFKIKFEIFGVQKIANVKAKTLVEAKIKLKEDIANQVKILSTDHKEPDNSEHIKSVIDKLPKDFTDIFGSIFGGRKP